MIGLPAGWAVTEFENIADLKLGKMLDKAKNKGTPFRYLRNVNVRWGGFDLSDLLEMRFTDDELETFAIENGDLLICEGGEPGRSAVWRNGTTQIKFQKALHRVRFEEGFSPDFFAAELRHAAVSGSLDELFVGTTIKHLTRQVLACRQVPVPPITEQRRIVAKLDALDARAKRARADLDRIPALVARAKQAVLSSFFGSRAARQKWDFKRIDEVGEVALGRQRSPENHSGPKMRPYVRSANITWQGINISDIKEMNFDDSDFEQFSLCTGDVLLNEGSGSAAEVGKPAIWRGEIEGCCFQNTVLRVRPKLCSSEFLYYVFLWAALSGQFISKTQGVNIFHIGKAGLSKFEIPLATLQEQREIIRRIESAFQKIDRIAADAASASKLLGRLDQAILTKAFRGELVPQNPEDEPASILLERIRATTKTAPRKGRDRKA